MQISGYGFWPQGALWNGIPNERVGPLILNVYVFRLNLIVYVIERNCLFGVLNWISLLKVVSCQFLVKKSLTGYSWHTASAHWTWRRTTFSALPYPLRLPDDISDRGRTWLEHRSPFVHWGEPLSQGLFICSLVPILSPEMDRALDGGPLWGSFLAGLRQNIIEVMSN